MNTTSQVIEFTPPKTFAFYFWESMPLINLALAVIATIRCVRIGRKGWTLVLWLLFIWLVPIIGPVVTLSIPRRSLFAS